LAEIIVTRLLVVIDYSRLDRDECDTAWVAVMTVEASVVFALDEAAHVRFYHAYAAYFVVFCFLQIDHSFFVSDY
jgi:hypothetical protein